ncbi:MULTISPECIES: HepT-like ribonuclease domain-containing protein [unclassified Enterococcus]|uniref:HepT-like ribonuclease domain-containing protein n=1 Tax=unclassified Enterococcus TaxID=2608891 RepID=UPI002476572A|nr:MULTISPECIES: HepT-like ribonuclease domain-containing protein [unclassified Enterococcus]
MLIGYTEEIKGTIHKYGDDYEIFQKEYDYRNSVSMGLLTIGEVINSKLSDELKEKYSNFNWQRLVRARHEFAHAYFQFDDEYIWSLIHKEVNQLAEYCSYLLTVVD